MMHLIWFLLTYFQGFWSELCFKYMYMYNCSIWSSNICDHYQNKSTRYMYLIFLKILWILTWGGCILFSNLVCKQLPSRWPCPSALLGKGSESHSSQTPPPPAACGMACLVLIRQLRYNKKTGIQVSWVCFNKTFVWSFL